VNERDHSKFQSDLNNICGDFDVVTHNQKDRFCGDISYNSVAGLDFAIVNQNAQRIIRTQQAVTNDQRSNYFLIFQHEGQSIVSQNNLKACLTPGEMFLMNPSQPLAIDYAGQHSKQISFHIAEEEILPHFGNISQNSLYLNKANRFVRGMNNIVPSLLETHITTKNEHNINQAFNGLLGLALEEAQTHLLSHETNETGLLQLAQDYMEQNSCNPEMSVALIAEELGLSMRKLQRLFKGTKLTPSQYLLHRRLENVCRQLIVKQEQKTDKTVSQIAYETGFNDLSYFNRAFKSKYGIAPGKWNS